MERGDLKKSLEKMDLVYDKFFITPELFNIWYECCKECDAETFDHAVIMYMKTNEFAPTVAGVMKCYNEINSYRRMISDLITSQYNMMRNVWEEPFNKETLKRFKEIVFAAPKESREGIISNTVNHAISYYHDCSYEGKTPPTLYEYLGGLT